MNREPVQRVGALGEAGIEIAVRVTRPDGSVKVIPMGTHTPGSAYAQPTQPGHEWVARRAGEQDAAWQPLEPEPPR
jgi:hypothetical protein